MIRGTRSWWWEKGNTDLTLRQIVLIAQDLKNKIFKTGINALEFALMIKDDQ